MVDVPCSFSSDTPVTTEDGLLPISLVKPGEQVLAYNEELDTTGIYTVTAVMVHQDPVLTFLIIDGESIQTTPEHPFYTEEQGWVPAGELWIGAHVRKADGSYGAVQTIGEAHWPQPMYNLTVAQAHTFFVGKQQWLVHNMCPIRGPAGSAPSVVDRFKTWAANKRAVLQRHMGVAKAGIAKQGVGLFGATPNLDALPNLEARRGKILSWDGMEKNVYYVEGAASYTSSDAYEKLVWLEPKWWGAPRLLESEVGMLDQLRKHGLPAANILGKTEYQGLFGIRKVAALQERMAAGSRNFIKWFKADEFDPRLSPLNEQTIKDLEDITRIVSEKQIRIQDMQFLVGRDGRVVINDPQAPIFGAEPDLRELNDLLNIARIITDRRRWVNRVRIYGA
jgi:hypothetical protein